MKVNALKNLIKEAVKEAIREELGKGIESPSITQEQQNSNSTNVNFTDNSSLNEMLSQTKSNMTREDFSNVMSFDSSNAQGFPHMKNHMTGNTMQAPSIPQGPQPGIDISKLDFVKNAASVYNLSVEKDKKKLG